MEAPARGRCSGSQNVFKEFVRRCVRGKQSRRSISEIAKERGLNANWWPSGDKQTGEKQLRPRESALPFRIWKMYKQMIKSLSSGKVAEFLEAGGTMAHYGGDACQPLHIAALHHGDEISHVVRVDGRLEGDATASASPSLKSWTRSRKGQCQRALWM